MSARRECLTPDDHMVEAFTADLPDRTFQTFTQGNPGSQWLVFVRWIVSDFYLLAMVWSLAL
jgi:hypothetical protein